MTSHEWPCVGRQPSRLVHPQFFCLAPAEYPSCCNAHVTSEIAQNDQVLLTSVSRPKMSGRGPGKPTGREPMPRYLALFKYSEAGAKGLMKDKAAAREAAGKRLMKALGGKARRSIGYPTENITARRFLNCQTRRHSPQFPRLSTPLELFQNSARSNC